MIKIMAGFINIYMILLWVLGGLIHLWTIYIAYSISGVFWGIVTFFFPVISQLVWGFNAWSAYGFDSSYIQWLIVLFVMWIANYAFAFILVLIENSGGENLDR